MEETYLNIISKFYGVLDKIGIHRGQDKILHAMVGFTIVFLLGFFIPLEFAILVGAVAGLVKEIYDWFSSSRDDSKFSFLDLFATILGAVAGMMAFALFSGAIGFTL